MLLKTLEKYIDHTLLKPDATKKEVDQLIAEAIEYGFKSVCVSPTFVAYAHKLLSTTDVLVCTVIGFPHGTHTKQVKAFETANACENGADELDMVINMNLVREGAYEELEDEIRHVVDAAGGRTVKVILETCLHTNEEIIEACKASERAGAHFVKTSTGYSSAGATIATVQLMKQTVGDRMEVKASGGVRSYEDAMSMLEAGATRIGTSGGVAIVSHKEHKEGY